MRRGCDNDILIHCNSKCYPFHRSRVGLCRHHRGLQHRSRRDSPCDNAEDKGSAPCAPVWLPRRNESDPGDRRDHNLALIKDVCQAHGATYGGRKVGSFGTGVFSFYSAKNMTTREGGMITTDDRGVAKRERMPRDHGSSRRYVHKILGYNRGMVDTCKTALAAIRSYRDGRLVRVDG